MAKMKHLLLTTIAAVVLVGCGPSVDIREAAEQGNIATVKQHLAAGADVNAKDDKGTYKGMTPLCVAAMSGDKEIAELLIAKGADVDTKHELYGTPLHNAANKEIAELLIANSADVNAKDGTGRTPLHWAAFGGHKEVAELLIAEGADVNAKADGGGTPLHGADEEVVELLIAAGADMNAKNKYGTTPLHNAAIAGQKEVAEPLIAKGADVNAKNDDGETPLDWAIDDKQTETADLLRKHGGKNGTIHSAARGGDFEAVREFLAAGTDVNIKDKYGKTPLDWAMTTETADLIRKHGGMTGEELKAEGN